MWRWWREVQEPLDVEPRMPYDPETVRWWHDFYANLPGGVTHVAPDQPSAKELMHRGVLLGSPDVQTVEPK